MGFFALLLVRNAFFFSKAVVYFFAAEASFAEFEEHVNVIVHLTRMLLTST